MFDKRAAMPLNPETLSPEGQKLQDELLKRVIGQDRAVKQLVRTYQTFKSGLQHPHKPMGVLLFLGPTGTGKTRLVEALAECLFFKRDAFTRIDCGEYTHDHEIAKLIGAPPGYLGHGKTDARLSQQAIDKHQRDDLKMSIVLFDEIEKASDDLYNLLLGILESGTLTLGDNTKIDFRNCLIIMTSNAGSGEMQKFLTGSGLGFNIQPSEEDQDSQLWEMGKSALKKRFSPEFLNRITRAIVFHPLTEEHLKQILNIELEYVQDRLLAAGHFMLLKVTDEAKDYIRIKGTDPEFNARELNRVIERLIVEPAANLLSTKQLHARDLLIADYIEGDTLYFSRLEDMIGPPPEE